MNEAKNTAIENKVARLEKGREKTFVREDIIHQTKEFIQNGNIKKFVGITLPAKGYFLEESIYNSFYNFPQKNTPSIQFHCAEKERKILTPGIMNRPEYCTVSKMTIEELLSKPIVFDKNRLGRADKKNAKPILDYNFVWADYCQRPNRKSINQVVTSIAKKKNRNGIYYFTFSLTRKSLRNIIKDMKGSLGKMTDETEAVQKAVNNYILYQFRKKCDKKTQLIYSVVYTGGISSKMITVGFLVGNVKVQTLFANRQKINQKKYSKNYQLIDRINKHTKKWLVQPRKEKTVKKSYSKSNLTLKDRDAISITYQACKKLGISRKGMSRMIADKPTFAKRKISVQQISAVISWLDSPKLRAKAVN